MKRNVGLVLVLVLSVLTLTFSGCVEEEVVTPAQPIAPRVEAAPTPAPTPKPTSTPTATPILTPTQPQEISQPGSIKLSGIGSGPTPIFQLESGTSIFRMTNEGNSNFTVLLVDTNAIEFCGCCYKYIDAVPADTIGPFDGVKTV